MRQKLVRCLEKAMFAVVRTGGKQYRVAAGDKIVVEKLAGEAGDTISLGDVLLAGEGSELKDTKGLTVSAEIIAQAKGDKVIVFKKRRRHNYRRKNGHRQQLTILRITAIGDHKAPAIKPAPRQEAAPAPEATEAAAAKAAPVKKEAAAAKPKAEAPKAEAKKADAGPKAEAKAPAKAGPTKKPATKKPAAGKKA
jgi:large subunit ribosomal protein L21